jgi:hypothetical protein
MHHRPVEQKLGFHVLMAQRAGQDFDSAFTTT